jgi:hypothetical protein
MRVDEVGACTPQRHQGPAGRAAASLQRFEARCPEAPVSEAPSWGPAAPNMLVLMQILPTRQRAAGRGAAGNME